MHSFHHSRGRIFFEAACALTISASCAGAWLELGVIAFLPAAAAAGLYGLWHLTDMRRPGTALAGQMLEGPPADEAQHEPLAYVSPEPQREPEALQIEVVEVEPEPAPKAKKPKRKKPAPKEVAVDLPAAPLQMDEPAIEVAEPADLEDEHHAPIVPLFEAQPVVRAPRPVFGRKAG